MQRLGDAVRFFVGAVLVLLVTTAAGLGGAVAGAKGTERVLGVLGLGVLLHLLSGVLLLRLLYRRREYPWRRAIPIALGWTAVVTAAALATFWPQPPVAPPTLLDRGAPFARVRLPTGSEIAFAQIGDASLRPRIVFLHGGPGGFVRASDVELARSLAASGFSVVLYDQAGGGASAPLPVRDYTVARHVADLEALRAHLGDERVALVGQSWGARLAYEYFVAHPERVTRMVLLSPGPLRAAHASFDVSRAGGRGPSFPPYVLLAFVLFQLSPESALDYMPRDELDAYAASQLEAASRRAVCRSTLDRLRPFEPTRGADAYGMIAIRTQIGNADAPAPPANVRVPSVVLRGECDYLVRAAAQDYADVIGARVVDVPGVGHQLWFPELAPIVARIVEALREGAPPPPPQVPAPAR